MKPEYPSLEINSLQYESYNPDRLLSKLKEHLDVTTDRGLAQKLGCPHIQIAKIRGRGIGVSANMLLLTHIATGLPFNTLRDYAGIPRYYPKKRQ